MANWAIGIDLGGTKIEGALISPEGTVFDRHRTFTKTKHGHEVIADQLIDLVDEIIRKNPSVHPLTVGIGVPGQIKKDNGMVLYAPNLDWHNVPLQSILQRKLNMHVIICNDVRAAAWGEWVHGAGINCQDISCVFVGTGIGGGIVSDGHMLAGANNSAAEIGHLVIDMHGPLCNCGNRGCFEAMAGGWAIARAGRDAVKMNGETGKSLLHLAGGDIQKISAKTVFEAAARGDTLAKSIVTKVEEALVAGFISIVNAYAPKKLIVGGGIIEGNQRLLPLIEKGIFKHALKAATAKLEVVPAMLRQDSGVIGAAAFALQVLQKNTYYGTANN